MGNGESGRKVGRVVRLVVAVIVLVVSAVALFLTVGLGTESAPQQTVQELRYIKWLLIGLIGLWLLKW